MTKRRAAQIDLFTEDFAHQEFLEAAIRRIAAEEGINPSLALRWGRGGHARVATELGTYQLALRKNLIRKPDLLVVGIDANCRAGKAKKAIEDLIEPGVAGRIVIACPNPHIERWYLADTERFYRVVGYRPTLTAAKCNRDEYKRMLVDAVIAGGNVPTLGGLEFARDLVSGLDPFKAGKADGALRHFWDEARGALRSVQPRD
jgi:hypothetical protein